VITQSGQQIAATDPEHRAWPDRGRRSRVTPGALHCRRPPRHIAVLPSHADHSRKRGTAKARVRSGTPAPFTPVRLAPPCGPTADARVSSRHSGTSRTRPSAGGAGMYHPSRQCARSAAAPRPSPGNTPPVHDQPAGPRKVCLRRVPVAEFAGSCRLLIAGAFVTMACGRRTNDFTNCCGETSVTVARPPARRRGGGTPDDRAR
jgi:hypothetical protein